MSQFWWFLAGILASLVINYITQYTSGPLAVKFRTWRERQKQIEAAKSIEKASRRITKLRDELANTESYVDNPAKVNIFIYRKLFQFLSLAIFGSFSWLFLEMMIDFMVYTSALDIFAYIFSFDSHDPDDVIFFFSFAAKTPLAFALLYLSDKSSEVLNLLRKIAEFPAYEASRERQIAELQAVVNSRDPEQVTNG